MFDVIPSKWTTEAVFTFDENAQKELQSELLAQMVDLGYESHNSILNLGSVILFTAVYFLEVIIYFVMRFQYRFTGKGAKKIEALKQ